MTKEYIYTEKAPSAIGAYSQAVKFNGIVYLSGQIPLDPKKMILISTEIEMQIEQVFINLSHVLNEAGSSLSEICICSIFYSGLISFKIITFSMCWI